MQVALRDVISDNEFKSRLTELLLMYYGGSDHYRAWCGFYYGIKSKAELTTYIGNCAFGDWPYLPANAFKYSDLYVCERDQIIKKMLSSGTSSGNPSKIYLDARTSDLMQKRLKIDTEKVIGAHRRPMLILDDSIIFKDRKSFAARGAAIAGLLKYGSPTVYLFNNGVLDNKVNDILKSASDLLIIGTTVNVWTNFLPFLESNKVNLGNAILIHGGGWKKLQSNLVKDNKFRQKLIEVANLSRVYNFFGMVEQLGSVSYQCDKGNFHAPSCSRYHVRSSSGTLLGYNSPGLLQVSSLLPESYPGACVLTDDLVELKPNTYCDCGSLGDVLIYKGRAHQSEVRGCGS